MNFSHLLLIRILTKPYKAWHAHYFPIPPKKIESGKAFTGIAALCAIASTQSQTVGGRLTRGKHCCLTILPKRLKVHSRSIQNKIYSSTFNCTRLRLFVGSDHLITSLKMRFNFQSMVHLESPGHICLTGCAQTYK